MGRVGLHLFPPSRIGDRDRRRGPGGARAPLWPFGQVLAAAIDVAALTGGYEEVDALVRGLEIYRACDGYAARPGRWRRRRYFDDNAWIGLALMQLHLQTGERTHLDSARRVLGFLRRGRIRNRQRTGESDGLPRGAASVLR